MPTFGAKSLANLTTCDLRLQRLFLEVVKHFDCTVTCGYRGQVEQEAAFVAGNSKLHFPNGNHNKLPSYAVDVYPYPVDMADIKRFYYFAGFVLGIASQMGIKIRTGCDWNNNTQVKDNIFNDLVHFEVVD